MSGSEVKSKQIKIGKVVGCRALKGELKLYLFSGEAPWQDKVKHVTLQKDGKSASFKVKNMDSVFIKLEGLNDRTQAEKWMGFEVYIDEDLLDTKSGESIYLREILGFSVSVEGQVVGVVSDFETNNSQDLLVVEKSDKKTVLIPLIGPFLDRIDYPAKTIFMNLPPGLLEVNS